MRLIYIVLFICIPAGGFFSNNAGCQKISHSFELRYVSDDPAANGETDFKGETAIFNTDDRIEFLHHYAEYARHFFNDPELDKKVVTDEEVKAALNSLKEQPLPCIRTRIPLKEWKWIGYGKDNRDKKRSIRKSTRGTMIEKGSLMFSGENVKLHYEFPPQTWRFFIRWKAKVPGSDMREIFSLSGEKADAATVGFNRKGHLFYCTGENEVELDVYRADTWYEFKIEVDLTTGRYNLYVNGSLKADYVSLQNMQVTLIDTFNIQGVKGTIDDIWGVGYEPTDDVRVPFTIATFIDEDFEVEPSHEGWNLPDYDDSAWRTAYLPIVHGGERYAGENLYLRKLVRTGDFSRAVLNVETLDPGGEIWVNGEVAAVLTNRHPASIDISNYLNRNDCNLVAVKVRHFYSKNPMGHAPDDRNIGWFSGRISLDLTAKTYIEDVFVHALDTADPARIRTRIVVKNEEGKPFAGNAVVNVYPWYPAEGHAAVATARFPVKVRAWSKEIIEKTMVIPDPVVWSFGNPHLYRFEIILEDETQTSVDDYIVTAGIRTVSQEGGVFRVNGKPEMLNGAQIMGFRMPLDKIAAWNRCAPEEWLMKELLMIKKMNGNLMRIHVHAWHAPSRNINDPRIAEMCDQLGIMLIWGTTGWIRSGEAWGIDFEGYPKYMRQVYNHPSIVMWEASNHPNRFKLYDFIESNLFYEKVYETIYPVDQSRLISATTHILFTHYGNDAGTVDWQGNPAKACPAWTAPMVTRGNQDSITGYGKEWTILRTWPPPYQKDFLESRERAYFNFEHEESIAQPNWSLVKGKPWYHLQSYEWNYDEGSIGRKLAVDEWQQSQAWQAFSAYESMRKQRILDYDGFSWCCLHGGANSGTYKKPLTDNYCYAKLGFYANRMVFQRVLAGSNNVDVVYGSDDVISPVIINLGDFRTVDLSIVIRNMNREVVDSKTYTHVELPGGRTVTSLPEFKPAFPSKGYYAIEYCVE